MRKITRVEDAKNLLHEIHDLIRTNGILFMNKRVKNSQTLADLEITASIQKQIIDSLQAEDYCGGPDPDEKYSWKSVSVFGTVYRGEELYIKFSVGLEDTPVVCLSFHKAGSPMTYQFK